MIASLSSCRVDAFPRLFGRGGVDLKYTTRTLRSYSGFESGFLDFRILFLIV